MRHTIMLGLLLGLGAGQVSAEGTVDHTLSLSVVQVRGYAEPGKLMYGSGVVVGPERVATNCHVVRAALKVAVSKGPMLYPATSQQVDSHHDICLLTTPNIPFPTAALGSAEGLSVGQPIYFYGYPRAIGITFSEGKVRGLHAFEGGRIIETSADFTLGASGGGVFDNAGKLVGLATFMGAGHTGGYYAVPVDWIKGLTSREPRKIEPLTGLSFWENAAAMPAFLKPPSSR